jgi:hypothetical protein
MQADGQYVPALASEEGAEPVNAQQILLTKYCDEY